MGTWVPETSGISAGQKDAVEGLAEVLRTFTMEKPLGDLLRTLVAILQVSDEGARVFLRAGGLPTLIRHLRGAATSDSDQAVASPDVADWAAEALSALRNTRSKVRLGLSMSDIPPLVDALRDAPTLGSRCEAVDLLLVLAKAQPSECTAIVEAGVFGLVLTLHAMLSDYTGQARDVNDDLRQVVKLARQLLCSGAGAANELRLAMLAPHPADCFTALVLAQVHKSCS